MIAHKHHHPRPKDPRVNQPAPYNPGPIVNQPAPYNPGPIVNQPAPYFPPYQQQNPILQLLQGLLGLWGSFYQTQPQPQPYPLPQPQPQPIPYYLRELGPNDLPRQVIIQGGNNGFAGSWGAARAALG